MQKRPPTNRRPAPSAPRSQPEQGELRGPLGFLDRNRQFLGWINLLAAVFLFYFTISGFAQGLVFLPFGYGMMALYFFYSYVRNTLKVDFGRITVPFNLVLLIGALVFIVIGLTNNN